MKEECTTCRFLPYCQTHDIPCILEKEPAQIIENLEACPKCDEIVETTKDFTPTCFIVMCSKCSQPLDHLDTWNYANS